MCVRLLEQVGVELEPDGAREGTAAPYIGHGLRDLFRRAAALAQHDIALMIEIVRTSAAAGTDTDPGDRYYSTTVLLYCTALVVNPVGELVLTYRKRAIPSDNG